jgi:hypothetical protein
MEQEQPFFLTDPVQQNNERWNVVMNEYAKSKDIYKEKFFQEVLHELNLEMRRLKYGF